MLTVEQRTGRLKEKSQTCIHSTPIEGSSEGKGGRASLDLFSPPLARPLTLTQLVILCFDHDKTHPNDGQERLEKKRMMYKAIGNASTPFKELESSLGMQTSWIWNCLGCLLYKNMAF